MSHELQSFYRNLKSREWRGSAAMGKASPVAQMHFGEGAKYSGTHSGTNPNSETNRSLANEKTFSVSIFRLSDPSGAAWIGWRGRPARERGLNENNCMVLVLSAARKAPTRPRFAQEVMHKRKCPFLISAAA
jgi:hypothetical protein